MMITLYDIVINSGLWERRYWCIVGVDVLGDPPTDATSLGKYRFVHGSPRTSTPTDIKFRLPDKLKFKVKNPFPPKAEMYLHIPEGNISLAEGKYHCEAISHAKGVYH